MEEKEGGPAEVVGSIAPARILTASDILAADDMALVAFDVPEWNGTVHLRVLSAKDGLTVLGELAKMKALPEAEKPNQMIAALRLVLPLCLVDEKGTPLFPTPEAIDGLLSARNHKVLLRLHNAAVNLQGWNGEDAAKNVSSGAVRAASRTA